MVNCFSSELQHGIVPFAETSFNMKFNLESRCCGTEPAAYKRVLPSGTHFVAKLTEAMLTKCRAQGHNILMQSGFEPSITVSRNRHLTHMTNMLQKQKQMCSVIL